jgi:hypothetical protein
LVNLYSLLRRRKQSTDNLGSAESILFFSRKSIVFVTDVDKTFYRFFPRAFKLKNVRLSRWLCDFFRGALQDLMQTFRMKTKMLREKQHSRKYHDAVVHDITMIKFTTFIASVFFVSQSNRNDGGKQIIMVLLQNALVAYGAWDASKTLHALTTTVNSRRRR